MKTYTILKIGYSRGVYGCSNEFFTCLYTSKGKIESFHFKGMYGVEERVGRAMKDAGYSENYSQSRYGQLKGEDRRHAERWSLGEGQAEKFIAEGFKDFLETVKSQ